MKVTHVSQKFKPDFFFMILLNQKVKNPLNLMQKYKFNKTMSID